MSLVTDTAAADAPLRCTHLGESTVSIHLRHLVVLVALAATPGCRSINSPVATSSASRSVGQERAPVQLWLTTGDQSRLLSREPDRDMLADNTSTVVSIATRTWPPPRPC